MPSFWDNYDQVVEQLLILCIIFTVQYYAESHYNKIPCRISNLSGEEYVESIIHQHHPRRIQEIFRMPLYAFLQFVIWLQENSTMLIQLVERDKYGAAWYDVDTAGRKRRIRGCSVQR